MSMIDSTEPILCKSDLDKTIGKLDNITKNEKGEYIMFIAFYKDKTRREIITKPLIINEIMNVMSSMGSGLIDEIASISFNAKVTIEHKIFKNNFIEKMYNIKWIRDLFNLSYTIEKEIITKRINRDNEYYSDNLYSIYYPEDKISFKLLHATPKEAKKYLEENGMEEYILKNITSILMLDNENIEII